MSRRMHRHALVAQVVSVTAVMIIACADDMLLSPGALTDEQIVAIARAANSAELQISQPALTHNETIDVFDLAFAALIEHTTSNQHLVDIGIEPAENSISRAIADSARAAVGRLNQLRGARFDSAYVAEMIGLHEYMINLFNETLLREADADVLLDYLEFARDVAVEHLEAAMEIRGATAPPVLPTAASPLRSGGSASIHTSEVRNRDLRS